MPYLILFLKGFIIGIGKIIPGVSGSVLAVSMGVYEKSLDYLANFRKMLKKFLFLTVFNSYLFILNLFRF